MTHTLSIILPTYNESGHIQELIRSIHSVCHPKEIIVVDDASPDQTASKAQSLTQEDIPVYVIRHPPPPGLTSSLQTGIAHATGSIIAWMDADFSHPPELLPRLYEAVQQADIAIGSTYVSGGADIRSNRTAVFFSWLINRCCQLAFGTTPQHYTSGFCMVRAETLRAFPLRGNYGEYCIDFLVRAHRQGTRIREVPFVCSDRRTGISKTATNAWGYLRRGRRYVATIISLLRRI